VWDSLARMKPEVWHQSGFQAERKGVGGIGDQTRVSQESSFAGLWWCTPVIPATQEAEIRGSRFEASPGKKTHHKKGLVE
jgi:hypothetical protein